MMSYPNNGRSEAGPPQKTTVPSTPPGTSSNEGSSYRQTADEKSDQIRTLFVSGLPQDVRYREVYNFFRFFSKFEHCVLNLKQRSPVAWVSFQTAEDAHNAQRKTNLLPFDPDNFDHKLNVELAKHNSVLKKRTHADIQHEQEIQKRYRMENGQQVPMASSVSAYSQYPPVQSYPPMSQYPNPRKVGRYPASSYDAPTAAAGWGGFGVDDDRSGGYAASGFGVATQRTQPVMNPIAYAQAFTAFHSHVSIPVTQGGNAACTTLFVANIHRDTTEDEIREAFQGCTRLRFNPPRESGGPICFVEYDSITTATQIREIMNGFRFKNDYGKGIKIEFAKNPMGTRSTKHLKTKTEAPPGTYGPSPYPTSTAVPTLSTPMNQ